MEVWGGGNRLGVKFCFAFTLNFPSEHDDDDDSDWQILAFISHFKIYIFIYIYSDLYLTLISSFKGAQTCHRAILLLYIVQHHTSLHSNRLVLINTSLRNRAEMDNAHYLLCLKRDIRSPFMMFPPLKSFTLHPLWCSMNCTVTLLLLFHLVSIQQVWFCSYRNRTIHNWPIKRLVVNNFHVNTPVCTDLLYYLSLTDPDSDKHGAAVIPISVKL